MGQRETRRASDDRADDLGDESENPADGAESGSAGPENDPEVAERSESDLRDRPRGGLGKALGLTIASTVVWGIAHIVAGRRVVGFILMGVFAALVAGVTYVVLEYRENLKQIAVQRGWLAGITVGILVLALIWVAIVVRSYQVVRPKGLALLARVLAGGMVVVLALGVCTPLVWAARDTYTLRDTIGDIFHTDSARPVVVHASDPWQGRRRVNVLLLGGDAAKDRVGVRTDSMTVASVDTKTGDTVLISLPRNLQHFPVIPRLRSRWPNGFTGVGAPGDQGLLNELFQDAEENPSLVPGFGKGRRGPELVREEISYLIGQPIDYYILVNLFGFADIVQAMGGVRVHITDDIPYGGPEDGSAPDGVLKAGDRKLNGKQALWYGRSRTASSDFVRMGRQKCLMKAIAEQADPQKILLSFQKLAKAAKRTISTNIPAAMLPALVKLSGTMKQGAQVTSLMFVPPEFHVFRPKVSVMHRATEAAIAASEADGANPSASATPGVSADPSSSSGSSGSSDQPSASASASPRGKGSKSKAVSLTSACK